MSDETSTSITGGQDPVYTTSLTSTIGRPPRRTYFVIQFLVTVATLGACWISHHFTQRVGEAEVKDWTTVTTLMMRVGELLTTPIGLACAIFIVLGLGLLAIRGAIDGILKFLIWANVIWLLCFLAYHTMAIWLPLIKAKQAAGH
jgi:hypothetical protein